MTLQLLKIQYHMGFSENRLLQNSSKSHSSSSFPIKFPISNSWAIPCFQTHLQNQSQSSLIAKGSPKCLDPAQISHVSAGLTCHWCICRKRDLENAQFEHGSPRNGRHEFCFGDHNFRVQWTIIGHLFNFSCFKHTDLQKKDHWVNTQFYPLIWSSFGIRCFWTKLCTVNKP